MFDHEPPITQQYQPSLALGIVGVVLATFCACYHIFLYFRLKAWCFYPMIGCTTLEIIGFTTRLVWIATGGKLLLYISFMVMMITPSLLAATCHMMFGRVLSYAVPPLQQSPTAFLLPFCAVAPVFVSFDLIALCFYILGGTLVCAAYDTLPSNANLLSTGLQVLKWSSIVQIAYLGLFVIATLRFFTLKGVWKPPVKNSNTIVFALASVICVSSTLIMLRGVYQFIRTQAAVANSTSYSYEKEWVFWVVDALPIFIIFLSFAVVHPGRCLPPSFTSYYLKRSTTPTVLRTVTDANDQSQSMLLMRPTKGKPLPPLPRVVNDNKSHTVKKSSLLKKIRGSWPSSPGRPRGYDEVNPYGNAKSDSTFMHGAL